jgi:transposase
MKDVRFRKDPHEWNGVEPWQWRRIALELPRPKKKPFLKRLRKGGRPRADDRKALSAILWRIRCGGTWKRLPEKFGTAATARRRLSKWMEFGRLQRLFRAYLRQLGRHDLLMWRDAVAGRDFSPDSGSWTYLAWIWRNEFLPRVPPGDDG